MCESLKIEGNNPSDKTERKTKMKAYKITATATDSNGVEISSNTAETLGEAYGMTYTIKERAEEVAEELASDLPEGYESSKYEVEEIEIDGLEEGELYDVASVADAMKPLPEGYNVADYFRNDRYLGADEDGVGISL